MFLRRRRRRFFLPAFDARVEEPVIDVAEGDDVLAHDRAGVAAAHAADADGGDVDRIARRLHAASEHVARDDDQPCPGHGCPRHEITPRQTCRFGVWLSFVSFRHGEPL